MERDKKVNKQLKDYDDLAKECANDVWKIIKDSPEIYNNPSLYNINPDCINILNNYLEKAIILFKKRKACNHHDLLIAAMVGFSFSQLFTKHFDDLVEDSEIDRLFKTVNSN